MFGVLDDNEKEACRTRLNDILQFIDILSPDLYDHELTRSDDVSDPEQEMYRWGYVTTKNNMTVTIPIIFVSYNPSTGYTSIHWSFYSKMMSSHPYELEINVSRNDVFTHINFGEEFSDDNVAAMFAIFNDNNDAGKILFTLTGGINTIFEKYKDALK